MTLVEELHQSAKMKVSLIDTDNDDRDTVARLMSECDQLTNAADEIERLERELAARQ